MKSEGKRGREKQQKQMKDRERNRDRGATGKGAKKSSAHGRPEMESAEMFTHNRSLQKENAGHSPDRILLSH